MPAVIRRCSRNRATSEAPALQMIIDFAYADTTQVQLSTHKHSYSTFAGDEPTCFSCVTNSLIKAKWIAWKN
jgi:hypothetical protein